MNNRTKRVAIIAGVLLIIAITGAFFAVREITIQSHELSKQIKAIELDRAQQTVFTRISRTDVETQTVRAELQNYFIESQSDSIDFLNYVEAQAATAGIELETLSPEEIERDGVTYLSISYSLKGSLARLENFIEQLENIPYVSQLQSMTLRQQASANWIAEVAIDVHVLNYEN